MNPLLRRLLLPYCLLLSYALFLTRPQPVLVQDDSEHLSEMWQRCAQGYEQGLYTETLPICQRLVDALEPLIPDDPGFGTALNYLAMLFDKLGNYPKAELLYSRSLKVRERALGLDHPDVARSLNNLAQFYCTQGSYPKAEPLLLRSLEIFKKTLGFDDPDVARSLNNLATFYERAYGNYLKAEPLLLHSLEIFEKSQGPEHPDVAQSLQSLAVHYYDQGNYSKAEPLLLRSLRIREKFFGPDNPDVATSLSELGGFYYSLGNYPKAEPLLLRSLGIRDAALLPSLVGSQQAAQPNQWAARGDASGQNRASTSLLLGPIHCQRSRCSTKINRTHCRRPLLGSVVRGYFAVHAVPTNWHALQAF